MERDGMGTLEKMEEKWVKIERDTAGCTKGFKDGNNWKGDPKQV